MQYTEYTVRVYPHRTEWLNAEGQLHREHNLPASEWNNGDREWYFNGRLHRTDGPAIEYADGYKAWYFNGRLHRTDGPAIERAGGGKEWYLEGKHLTEAQHAVAVNPAPCEGKVVTYEGQQYRLTAVKE